MKLVYVPIKVEKRIKSNLNKYKRILRSARDKDINEADTVRIVNDILTDVMGYDKYSEITSEYAIRGTYCDLAIEIEDTVHFLIEVKRIGVALKEQHMRQALEYASREGIEYVVLTNGADWDIYRVVLKKQVLTEQIFSLNFIDITPKNRKVMEQIFSISREGIEKTAIQEIHEEKRVTNRYTIAGLITSEPILTALKREIRKISKRVKVDDTLVLDILRNGVLKRDVVEGEKAKQASQLIKKRMKKNVKKKAKKVTPPPEAPTQ